MYPSKNLIDKFKACGEHGNANSPPGFMTVVENTSSGKSLSGLHPCSQHEKQREKFNLTDKNFNTRNLGVMLNTMTTFDTKKRHSVPPK